MLCIMSMPALVSAVTLSSLAYQVAERCSLKPAMCMLRLQQTIVRMACIVVLLDQWRLLKTRYHAQSLGLPAACTHIE